MPTISQFFGILIHMYVRGTFVASIIRRIFMRCTRNMKF